MPSRPAAANVRLRISTDDTRWRCPSRWVNDAEDGPDLPELLWGQPRTLEALDVSAALHRPDQPRHLQLVTHPGPSWAPAVQRYLQTQAKRGCSVTLLDRLQARLLRGEAGAGAGLLHRCDGGIVVVDVDQLLDEPAWTTLSEAMSLGSVARLPKDGENAEDGSLVVDSARISVVLVGPDPAFKRLREQSGDFADRVLEKVITSFELPRDRAGVATVTARLRHHARTAKLGKPSTPALAWLVEELAGSTARRGRISLQLEEAFQCLEEARLLQPKGTLKLGSVQAALARLQERRATAEGNHRARVELRQLLLQADGAALGVVNGLMVYGSGHSAYCIPGRITARISVGREGLVNVEREAKYSGRSFDKGVFLLNGFLRGLFAQESPLGLGATLAFEQSYGKVDGDSATLSEAIALLSELSGLPCRQDIAVTGAINQRGELLPVGSINLKVIGWWKTCGQLGRTGSQGVLLPRSSVAALQISTELQDAIESGAFHLWAADSIEDAVELLLNRPAGLRSDKRRGFAAKSVYDLAGKRLAAMSQRLYPKRGEPAKKKTGASAAAGGGRKERKARPSKQKPATAKKKADGQKAAAEPN